MIAPASRTLLASTNARPLVWPAKDPNEVEDYGIDFTDRLGCDMIASATWSLATPAGLTVASSEFCGPVASATFSGGTEGLKGKALCRLVTTNGRTLDDTAQLPIRSR